MSRQTRTADRAATDRALDQVEVRAVVDHQHRRRLGSLGLEPRHTGDRAPVDGRVGDDDIVESLLGEVERLGR